MRHPLIMMLLLAALACMGCSGYRVSLLRFEQGNLATSVKTGAGQAEICRQLFAPPRVYTGPAIAIPAGATTCGGVLVTAGSQHQFLLLRTWTDEAGQPQFGCNGPAPVFARMASTPEALYDELTRLFLKP